MGDMDLVSILILAGAVRDSLDSETIDNLKRRFLLAVRNGEDDKVNQHLQLGIHVDVCESGTGNTALLVAPKSDTHLNSCSTEGERERRYLKKEEVGFYKKKKRTE